MPATETQRIGGKATVSPFLLVISSFPSAPNQRLNIMRFGPHLKRHDGLRTSLGSVILLRTAFGIYLSHASGRQGGVEIRWPIPPRLGFGPTAAFMDAGGGRNRIPRSETRHRLGWRPRTPTSADDQERGNEGDDDQEDDRCQPRNAVRS